MDETLQVQYNAMVDRLRERGFKRIDVGSWVYTFPDAHRFIAVKLERDAWVEVNFNDEEYTYHSFEDVLDGLNYFKGN